MLMNTQSTMPVREAPSVAFRPPPGLPPPAGMLVVSPPPGLGFPLESALPAPAAQVRPSWTSPAAAVQLPRLLGSGFAPNFSKEDKQARVADPDDAIETGSSDCSTADTADSPEAEGAASREHSSSSLSLCGTCSPVEVLSLEAALSAPTPKGSEVYEPGLLLLKEAQQVPMKVLHLADSIKEPGFICAACPSIGSAGHALGICKPCDFVHRGSCRTGAACKFCHLCGPEENKQRKKEKRATIRSVKRWNNAVTGIQWQR